MVVEDIPYYHLKFGYAKIVSRRLGLRKAIHVTDLPKACGVCQSWTRHSFGRLLS